MNHPTRPSHPTRPARAHARETLLCAEAGSGPLGGVALEAFQDLSARSFRSGQVEVLTALLTGHDVLARQPTGSGKTLVYHVSALHLWRQRTVAPRAAAAVVSFAPAGGSLPGLTLVVVPFRALAFDQLREANDFLVSYHGAEGKPVAVFVDRSRDGRSECASC
jgi:superfamily II DNA helicase RecQ